MAFAFSIIRLNGLNEDIRVRPDQGMAGAVDYAQLGARNAPRQHVGVRERYRRILRTGNHERWTRDLMQPWAAVKGFHRLDRRDHARLVEDFAHRSRPSSAGTPGALRQQLEKS